jgi:hypothetical protein
LLGVLASRAASEYAEGIAASRGAVPEYMRSFTGEAVGDPALPGSRAEALYELLERETFSASRRGRMESPEAYEAYEAAEGEAEAEAEAWELFEYIDSFNAA